MMVWVRYFSDTTHLWKYDIIHYIDVENFSLSNLSTMSGPHSDDVQFKNLIDCWRFMIFFNQICSKQFSDI